MTQGISSTSGMPSRLPVSLGGTRSNSVIAGRILVGQTIGPQISVFATNSINTVVSTGGTANPTNPTTSPTVTGQMLLTQAANTPLWSATTCLYPSSSGWTTYTPTITVSGGTVPTYTAINSGRWRQIGNVVHVRIVLTNAAGGTPGAGANAIVVALPATRNIAGSSIAIQQVGYALNGATFYLLRGSFASSATTLTLQYYNALTTVTNLTGALQNNAVRELHLSFCYER